MKLGYALLLSTLLGLFVGCPPATQEKQEPVGTAVVDNKSGLVWEILYTAEGRVFHRTKTPSGWLVLYTNSFNGVSSMEYVEDNSHAWLTPMVEDSK